MSHSQCNECGCVCSKCNNIHDQDLHLHEEIEGLKRNLAERDNHIVTMETNFLNEANKYPNGELIALHDELLTWQDKYKRLYEAHRRVQRVNQGLEDKLLKLVDVCETDKNALTKDIATLSHKLAEANYKIKKLTEDNERYKNDVSLAIQFLQCKQGNFVSQKFDSLPNEVQAKVSNYMGTKKKTDERKTAPEVKSIKVPIPTFPPTAMVYSVPKSQSHSASFRKVEEKEPTDIVSAAIMAKVLEERERERACIKHCDTCTCSKQIRIVHETTHHTTSTQTIDSDNDKRNDSCKCNNALLSLDERQFINSSSTSTKSTGNVKAISLTSSLLTKESNCNKSVPIYMMHDKDSPVVINNPNNASNQNIAKVQPNNFLLNDNFTQNNFKFNIPPQNPCSNKSDSEDLIDLNTSSEPEEDVKIININEKAHSNSVRPSKVSPPSSSNNILLDNSIANVKTQVYNLNQFSGNSPGSVESGECSTTTLSSISNNNFSMESITNNERINTWINSNEHNETVPSCSSVSDNNSEQTQNVSTSPNTIDNAQYKRMEEHVKKFLFGECTLLSDITVNK